jgi:hypothetical protein
MNDMIRNDRDKPIPLKLAQKLSPDLREIENRLRLIAISRYRLDGLDDGDLG